MLSVSLLLALLPAAALAQSAPDGPVAEPDFDAAGITWDISQNSAGFILVVSGPNGYHSEQSFGRGAQPAFQAVDASGAPLADGLYKCELRPVSYGLTKSQHGGQRSRSGRGPGSGREPGPTRRQSRLGLRRLHYSERRHPGPPNAVEEQTQAAAQPQQSDSPSGIDAPADIIHADDVIIQNSLCVGFDCVNGVSFGFDTIRLKENNLRIKFQDTSTGSFPSRDWQLTANDSSSGGANKFSIEDIDGRRTPFTIEAGAPSHSLYVDDGGRIGLGTSTPVVEVHVVDGDTPTVRLQQDGSSGFGQQIWDMAGNETNFFVRDVTNGSKLPFKIFPNAPTNSLIVEGSTGDLGVGIQSPTASLHVKRSDGTAQILVEEANGTADIRTLAELKNNGATFLAFNDTSQTAQTWRFGSLSGNMAFQTIASDTTVATRYILESDGDVFITGNLTVLGASGCTGCRTTEEEKANSAEVLNRLSSIFFVRWQSESFGLEGFDSQLGDEQHEIEHISPNMQSFKKVYGLGLDGKSIAPLDVASVALAAAQALNEQDQLHSAQISTLQSEISTLQQQNATLEARLAAIEAELNLPTPETSTSKSSIFVPSVQR